jgi:hypothetical protein
MNIEQLQMDKKAVENRFNEVIEAELMAFVNKYKGINVSVYFNYEIKENMDGIKYLNGKTKIKVEL